MHTQGTHFLAFCIAASALAACVEDIPDAPTWSSDIKELLTANCGRCHGPVAPASHPNVPTDLRLDLYETRDPDLRAATDVLDRIRARAVDYESGGETQMPPDSYLTNHQKELLGRWLDGGAPF